MRVQASPAVVCSQARWFIVHMALLSYFSVVGRTYDQAGSEQLQKQELLISTHMFEGTLQLWA